MRSDFSVNINLNASGSSEHPPVVSHVQRIVVVVANPKKVADAPICALTLRQDFAGGVGYVHQISWTCHSPVIEE